MNRVNTGQSQSLNSDVSDTLIQQAIDIIKESYGDTVSVENKRKPLIKFGRNDSLGTSDEIIWLNGGLEDYATGNDINTIVSDDASDTQDVIVEGHTISGSDLTFVVQTVTLDGLTPVTLDTPLYRATRLYNNDSVDFAGTVTLKESDNTVHLVTDGSNNQSLKCATSLSSQDYWIITALVVGVNKQQSASVDFKLQIREFGKVFRTRFPISAHSNSGSIVIPLPEPIIARPNSDVHIVGSASASTGANATIIGKLAKIVS